MRVAFVLGTRPELLKLIPVLRALEARFPGVALIVDTQQQTMLKEWAFAEYGIETIERVRLESGDTGLAARLGGQLIQLGEFFARHHCTGAVVHGDTTSALAGALAAFYSGLEVAHVEAGLRSGDLREPFPEEMHRRTIACSAALHLAPSEVARDALMASGIKHDRIAVIGNTLTDLCQVSGSPTIAIDVLVTVHRREGRYLRVRNVCRAVNQLATKYPRLRFGIVEHSHPEVSLGLDEFLSPRDNVLRLAPASHRPFLAMLNAARLVMTDSGGIQEEATMMGRSTLVLRNALDRQDGLAEGTAVQVGIECEQIVAAAHAVLARPPCERRPAARRMPSPGRAAAEKLIELFSLETI